MNEWHERYAASGEPLWSGRANGVLVGELAGHAPDGRSTSTRPRVDPVHEGSPSTHDDVLRARRSA
jgi:hypothetical protein